MIIRPASEPDFEAILRLNHDFEHVLSPLDRERLEQLHRWAAYHKVVYTDEGVMAVLLAFREGTEYDSPNYRWFANRYTHFLYVDRIIVSAASRGKQYGSALYEDLFAAGRRSGVTRVTCEFDVKPLNEASQRFHQCFGFYEVGTQRSPGANKTVSLQQRML